MDRRNEGEHSENKFTKVLSRNQSAKILRHEKAKEKYKYFEENKNNEQKLKGMISGGKYEEYKSTPGEYLVVTSGKNQKRGAHLDIPLMDLLDGTKTFSELKTAKSQQIKKVEISSIKSPQSAITKTKQNQIK